MSITKNIFETLTDDGNFKTLLSALNAAGLTETLQGTSPFTLFAPTDQAFTKIPDATLTDLLKPENKEKLAGILNYHVVAGKVLATDVAKLTTAKTINGQELKIDLTNGVKINNATVASADVEASNGVIHIIDAVLMPAVAANA